MSSNILEERVGSDSSHVKKEDLHVVINHEEATSTTVAMESNQKECLAKSDDILQDVSEKNNDDNVESNVTISEGGVKSKDGDPMPSWHDILQDATELESLIFCVRRPSARDKLFKFVDNLKKLSGKLKRHEDVTFKRNDKSTSIESFLKKRSIGDNDSSDDVSRVKKPRAISFPKANNAVNSPNSNSSPVEGNDAEDLQSMMPQSLDPTIQVPLLKHRDKWVQHHKRRSHLHCPDFEASNKCPLGTKCDHWHIYTPKKPNLPIEKDGATVKLIYTKEDVHRAYRIYRDATLSKNDYYEKIKNNELNFPNYCCAIKCPLDHTIYYAQPFPGDRNVKANKSSQGIWWYMTMKDAKEAVATQMIFDLKERGIVPYDFLPYGLISDAETGRMNAVNKASEMARLAIVVSESRIKEQKLPDITPLNYMETDCEKRCAHFNTPRQCAYGSRCRCAHVYYPSEVNSTEFPDREALVFAYKENFQIMLQDPFFLVGSNEFSMSSPFRVMTAVDDSGVMWYTAAMKCPYEGTIYYAAGGNTGKLNSQNIVLYPTAEDAKLAVAGIVLDSFKNRGLVGCRRISPQMNKIPKPPMQGKTSPIIIPLPPYVTTCQQSHLINQSHNSINNLGFPAYSEMGSYVNQTSRGYDLGFQNKNDSTSGTSHGGH